MWSFSTDFPKFPNKNFHEKSSSGSSQADSFVKMARETGGQEAKRGFSGLPERA